jgi:hypothetical protein
MDFPVEKVSRRQRIVDWFQLVSETFMEFSQNTSIFLDDNPQVALVFILTAFVLVGDIKCYNTTIVQSNDNQNGTYPLEPRQ